MFPDRQTQSKKVLSEGLMLMVIGVFLAILIHGFLMIIERSYQGTYDAFVHIFFASKVKNNFGATWVYNWFEGIDLVSYPPFIPQLIAIFSYLIGLENGYVATQLLGLAFFVTGAYRFCRLWLDPVSAGYGAISAAMLTSVAQQVHQFGQLPTCFATGLALHAIYHFTRWCMNGGGGAFLAGLLYTLCVSLAHHLTFFLFVPFAFVMISITVLIGVRGASPETISVVIRRIMLFALIGSFSSFALLYPFFDFVLHKMPQQIEIPHATRLNYLSDIRIFQNFFIAPLATCVLALLFLPKIFRDHLLMRPLILGAIFLAILGLGGTTFIPRLFFGKYWQIFTFDRFAAWCSILLLPSIAYLFSWFRRPFFRLAMIGFYASLLVAYIFVLRSIKFQPDPVDLKPVANFLDLPGNKYYRYVTFGLGSQMARLSYMTTAPSVDGLYFQPRTPEVLRKSGIEAIDSAKYFGDQGKKVIDAYLGNPERYHLKYAILNDDYYVERLKNFNWQLIRGDFGDLRVWVSHKEIRPLPASYFKQKLTLNPLSRFFWSFGVFGILIAIFVEVRIWMMNARKF